MRRRAAAWRVLRLVIVATTRVIFCTRIAVIVSWTVTRRILRVTIISVVLGPVVVGVIAVVLVIVAVVSWRRTIIGAVSIAILNSGIVVIGTIVVVVTIGVGAIIR